MDISEDGGVIKEVLVAAPDGAGSVNVGDAVQVHYRGTVQGAEEEFDSSYGSGYPFTFKVGEGKVIRAWDMAVPTMKIGEKCRLTVAAEYGYGEEGSGDDIPPGATLVFEMEVVGVKGRSTAVRDRDMERLAKIRAERAAKKEEAAKAKAAEDEARRARIAANQAKRGGRKKKKKKKGNNKK